MGRGMVFGIQTVVIFVVNGCDVCDGGNNVNGGDDANGDTDGAGSCDDDSE